MDTAGNASTEIDPLDPVFISYRQSDGTPTAFALAWALRAAGVPVWHDQTDLPPGDTKQRLEEALDSGLSGAILLITPDIRSSTIVRDTELPRLLALAQNTAFTLSVASTIHASGTSGQLDYKAPDRLLKQPKGTLSGLDQAQVGTAAQIADVAFALVRRRMEQVRGDVVTADGQLSLDVQTRIPPFAAKHDAHVVLRLRPPLDGERRPHADGLNDLRRFLGQLPQLVAISGASKLLVRGGAHLSVACALGAALPTTLVGSVEVVDTAGTVWRLTGQAPGPSGDPLIGPVNSSGPSHGRGPVLVYVDLLPQRSDTAFDEFVADDLPGLAGVVHLRPISDELLDPANAAAYVGEITGAIRDLASQHQTTEVHLLLRCPYPLALLVGRSLNTLTVHLYEWEDDTGTPRYVPSVILRSGAGGSPIHEVTAPPV